MIMVCSSKRLKTFSEAGSCSSRRKDAANRLVDALLDQGDEVIELVRQTLGTHVCSLP
jgi:hypothetical protein